MGFFDEFCEILKTSFFQATVSILRKKYYTNKIVKKSLRKEKNGNSLLEKRRHAKQKLNHYLHEVFISFYYEKISLFLFSPLPMIY